MQETLINAVINHRISHLQPIRLIFLSINYKNFTILTPNRSLCYQAVTNTKVTCWFPRDSRTLIAKQRIQINASMENRFAIFNRSFSSEFQIYWWMRICRIRCETSSVWMCWWYWWVEELLERTATSSAINKTVAATSKSLPARRVASIRRKFLHKIRKSENFLNDES